MPKTITMTDSEKLGYASGELFATYVANRRRGEDARCDLLAEALFVMETGTHYDADGCSAWDEFAKQLAGRADVLLQAERDERIAAARLA